MGVGGIFFGSLALCVVLYALVEIHERLLK